MALQAMPQEPDIENEFRKKLAYEYSLSQYKVSTKYKIMDYVSIRCICTAAGVSAMGITSQLSG